MFKFTYIHWAPSSHYDHDSSKFRMDQSAFRRERDRRLTLLRGQSVLPVLSLFNQPAPGTVELLTSGLFSDFTIKCGDISFAVHKSTLYVQSDYFKRVTDGRFTESSNNEVTLKETEPVTVGMLLLMMYIGDRGQYLDEVYKIWPSLGPPAYSGTSENDAEVYFDDHFRLELQTLIEVYVLADRLLVAHIADAVATYITAHLDAVLIRALDVSDASLFDIAVQDLSDILQHIYSVTSTEDVKLREETTMVCLSNQSLLKKAPAIIKMVEESDGRVWRSGMRTVSRAKEIHDKLMQTQWASNVRIQLATTGQNRPADKGRWVQLLNERLWQMWGLW